MRRLAFAGAGALALAWLAGPALAQEASGCSKLKWPVDRELAAFAGSAIPTLAPGGQVPGLSQAVTLTLTPQAQQSFAVPPTHKPHGDAAFAGVFPLAPVATAGSYQVTVSGEAWIDVVQDGKILKQTAFTGSHDCAAVRKSVRFDLADGPASLMISDAVNDTIKAEILPQQ